MRPYKVHDPMAKRRKRTAEAGRARKARLTAKLKKDALGISKTYAVRRRRFMSKQPKQKAARQAAMNYMKKSQFKYYYGSNRAK